MKQRNCPACEETENKNLGKKLGFDFVVCKKCGTLYTLQEPNEGEEQNYEDYGGYGKENAVPEFVHQRCDELIKPFANYRQLNTFLDVGFGAGTIIQASARANWKVSGVEVSKNAVEFLANKYPNFDLYNGYLEERKYPDNSFDAVAVVEVVEHVLNPTSILQEVFRILRPGGVVWMTTPNLHSLSWSLLKLNWSMVTPPDHLELYPPKAAKLLLESCGFQIKRVETHGINPFEIVNYYKTKGNFVPDERVSSGYQLNESLESSGKMQLLKNSINKVLNVTKFGDSMKVWAEKPLSSK
jgi:SAM-dependent methyltransferase